MIHEHIKAVQTRIKKTIDHLKNNCYRLKQPEKQMVVYNILENIVNEFFKTYPEKISACQILYISLNMNRSSEWYTIFAQASKELSDTLTLEYINIYSLFIN